MVLRFFREHLKHSSGSSQRRSDSLSPEAPFSWTTGSGKYSQIPESGEETPIWQKNISNVEGIAGQISRFSGGREGSQELQRQEGVHGVYK